MDGFTPASGRDDETLGPDLRALGRELTSVGVKPHASRDFVDRVMSAIRSEPVPTPARTLVRALGELDTSAARAAVSLGWRLGIGWGSRFPVSVRAQAMALVLVVALALASGATAGLVAGARLIQGALPLAPVPARSVVPTPSLATPRQTHAPHPGATSSPSEPKPRATGSSPAGAPSPRTEGPTSSPSSSEAATPSPGETAQPSSTPEPTPTETPTTTPESTSEP